MYGNPTSTKNVYFSAQKIEFYDISTQIFQIVCYHIFDTINWQKNGHKTTIKLI